MDMAYRDEVLDKREKQFMLPSDCSTPYFYHLLKLHKSIEHPRGRHIVASIKCFLSGLSQYIDFYLQPIVANLLSYIRDSGQVIEALKAYSWEEYHYWASLDVVSLHTSIPHKAGLMALCFFLMKDSNMNSRQSHFLMDSSRFCLEHNYYYYFFFLPILPTNTWDCNGHQFCPGIHQHYYGLLRDVHLG